MWKPTVGGGGGGGGVVGRGQVKIRLLLSTEKDQTLTAQEHKYLLKILFASELQKTQVSSRTFHSCIITLFLNLMYLHSASHLLGTAASARSLSSSSRSTPTRES
jgi:hypothetical protein